MHNTSHPGIDLNVLEVWDEYQGNGVVVGIIDTGIDYDHPDLSANYRTDLDYDAHDSDSDSFASTPDDDHGTVVAGVVAAALGDGDVVGVAPGADITGFRIAFGFGTEVEILIQMANMASVDVANNSWGYDGFFFDNFDNLLFHFIGNAVGDAVKYGRGGLGTVVVFSAGNDGDIGQDVNYHSFQSSRYTIAVGAIEEDGDIASFSTPGAAVLVSAPGVGIHSTDVQGGFGYSPGSYTTLNGTSFAAPAVSAVAALMLEANPALGYRDVQEILAHSAINPTTSGLGWQTNGAGTWNGGGLTFSHDYGYGLVDAHAAVRLAETWATQSTEANIVIDAYSNLTTATTIPDNATITKTFDVTTPLEIDHVEAHLVIDHPWIGDLTVTLTSPSGLTSTLVNRPGLWAGNPDGSSQDDINFTFTSVAHWGETGVGTWTLEITDNAAGNSGTLLDWDLAFYGDAFSNDDVYIFTDEWSVHGSETARQTLSDSSGIDTLNFAAVTSAIDLSLAPGATSTILGHPLTLDAGTTIEKVFGGDGDDTVDGNDADNEIHGMRGADVLFGGSGQDILLGGDGLDSLVGGLGQDILLGGAGLDDLEGNEDTDLLYGGEDDDVLDGGLAQDILIGGTGADTLRGDEGIDLLTGNDGFGVAIDGYTDVYDFDTLFSGGPDIIAGFDTSAPLAGGDQIDLADLLATLPAEIPGFEDAAVVTDDSVAPGHTVVAVAYVANAQVDVELVTLLLGVNDASLVADNLIL